MNKDYILREMTIEDVCEVENLEQECFSLPWSKNAIIESLSLQHSVFVVAVLEGEIIGYGGVYVVCGEAEITNIAVGSKYRKQGVGRAIVERIVEESVKRDSDTILLEVRESNMAAIHLYEKCGFEKIGTRKNFYEKPVENAVIMWKKVQ